MKNNPTQEDFDRAVISFETHFKNFEWFEFRQYQKETIISIARRMYFDFEDKNVEILDAPTGSGKSIIAIGVSLILNNLGLTGYIVTADLELQRQYQTDINKYNTKYISLMGKSNYFCDVNNKPVTEAACLGKSVKDIKKLSCYGNCEYYTTLSGATNSKTTIFNYSIWLIYINTVLERAKVPPFMKRDFVIFDEAHKIDEIAISSYAPIIPEIGFLYSLVKTLLDDLDVSYTNDYEDELTNCYEELLKETDSEELLIILYDIKEYLSSVCSQEFQSEVVSKMNIKYLNKVPKKIMQSYHNFENLCRLFTPLDSFLEYVDSDNDSEFVKCLSENGRVVTIKPLNTFDLCKRYLFNNARRSLVMSATFGEYEQYKKISGIEKANITTLDNTFNYKMSPIWLVNQAISMNYKNLFKGIQRNINNVKRILNIHPTRKGIIHSGTYNISTKVYNALKNVEGVGDRLFYYANSKDKQSAIERFKKSENGVLIGSTLLEGISLDDDLSRFQIVLKVPYLSLADSYIKTKMERDSSWYQWKTALKLLQGDGRSIRNKDDWALTYICDIDFHKKFFKYSSSYLSRNFIERYKSIDLSYLEKLRKNQDKK